MHLMYVMINITVFYTDREEALNGPEIILFVFLSPKNVSYQLTFHQVYYEISHLLFLTLWNTKSGSNFSH